MKTITLCMVCIVVSLCSFAQISDGFIENICGTPHFDSDSYSDTLHEERISTDMDGVRYVRLAFHFLLPGGTVTEEICK